MFDAIDTALMTILQREGRAANADLARRLGMAPSAIHQRLRRLEERGAIRGFAARLDPEVVGCPLVAFIRLRTDEALGDFTIGDRLAELPEVLELHDIAGEDCYLAKVRVADTGALHSLIRERIATIEGVRSTATTIVMKTMVERDELPLPPPNGTKTRGTNGRSRRA